MEFPSNFAVVDISAISRRETILATTYGVVAISIGVQGLTFLPLLKRLGIVGHRMSI